MIADFFTKPLQGNLYRKFRDVILGYVHIRTLFHDDEKSSSQERVSKKNTEGHSGEINDIHQRHDGEKENKDDSKPQNKGVTWNDIVKRGTMFESIKNNSH